MKRATRSQRLPRSPPLPCLSWLRGGLPVSGMRLVRHLNDIQLLSANIKERLMAHMKHNEDLRKCVHQMDLHGFLITKVE